MKHIPRLLALDKTETDKSWKIIFSDKHFMQIIKSCFRFWFWLADWLKDFVSRNLHRSQGNSRAYRLRRPVSRSVVSLRCQGYVIIRGEFQKSWVLCMIKVHFSASSNWAQAYPNPGPKSPTSTTWDGIRSHSHCCGWRQWFRGKIMSFPLSFFFQKVTFHLFTSLSASSEKYLLDRIFE